MILITTYFSYALSIIFLAGFVTRRLFERLHLFESSTSPPALINTFILGMISLTTVVSFLSVVTPITPLIHLGVVILLLISACYHRVNLLAAIKQFFLEVKSIPYLFALGLISVLSVILLASGPVGYFDTGLYHVQAVKWINEYGSVPGLGNLHHRLAFNSSWFYFSAFFDILTFDGKTAHLVNPIAFTLGLGICFSGFYNLFTGNIAASQVLKCCLALPICADRMLSAVLLPTLSPDLIVVILLLYAIILGVNYIEQQETSADFQPTDMKEKYIVLLCLSFFLPTIKLNTLPILLLPLFLLTRVENRTVKTITTSFFVGLIVLLPFLITNVILSGYLIFPFPQVDLFSFDWKIPYHHADNVRRTIKYFAIHPTPGRVDWSIADMSTLEWMQFWYKGHRKIQTFRWIIPSLFAALTFFTVCFWRRSRICLDMAAIQGIILLGVMYWFFSAPSYRFGMGWIWAFIILSLGSLTYILIQSLRLEFVSYLTRGALVLFCVLLLNFLLLRWDTLESVFGGPSDLFWKIRNLPEEKVRVVKIHDGFTINVPLRDRAWNADLPSTPYVKYNLQMRGSTLGEGFRIVR
jgi:hypothetical protein